VLPELLKESQGDVLDILVEIAGQRTRLHEYRGQPKLLPFVDDRKDQPLVQAGLLLLGQLVLPYQGFGKADNHVVYSHGLEPDLPIVHDVRDVDDTPDGLLVDLWVEVELPHQLQRLP